MNFQRAEAIARAVLYEGYNLYPYRPSALKNRQRWTFGGVFPRDWSTQHADDRSRMQTECLVRGGADSAIEIRVRFLHIVAREIAELEQPIAELPGDHEPACRCVPLLEVGGMPHQPWEEARERDVAVPTVLQELLVAPVTMPFAFAAQRDLEPIRAADGNIAALAIRTADALAGDIAIAAEPVAADVFRLTIRIENQTPLGAAPTMSRDRAQRFALASTHTLLGVEGGAFMSLLDPPPMLRQAAAACRNEGTWPVLVGPEGEAALMLSSPIILYDNPQIAPESPGDLFDGCEIDEILILRILTMTDAEKREMAAADPRSRALLERTEALGAEELALLHGTFRDSPSPPLGAERAGVRWGMPERPTISRVAAPTSPSHAFGAGPSLSPLKGGEGISGVTASIALRVGDRVRLKPRPGGDVMDVVLRDQVAIVEAIERDFEDRVHVAVTMLDDPGRDLGMARMPGHRFFFAPDEMEPIETETAA